MPDTGLGSSLGVAEPAVPAGGIAIIGMAGRFPGAGSIAAFWDNLRHGRCAGEDFPDVAPDLIGHGYPLADIDRFDAAFFDISPREAALMDPQHRLFLEEAVRALEDAGIAPGDTDLSIGVFAGCNFNTYLFNLTREASMARPAEFFDIVLGNDKDYLATRVSYKLGLRGPSLLVQSSCSTSLSAVAVAAQALLSGQCDVALAGGVGIRAQQRSGYLAHAESGLSQDGRVRAFSADASGVTEGNGLGLVVLRRLEEALAAGDTIHAVIRGFAVNNDGAHKAGFTAPSIEGQAAAIAEALAMADLTGAEIGYVEAHGTATPIGDPIEIAALRQGFGPRPEGVAPCGIGSVKSNIGHLNAAAGVAGLIKAVLALREEIIPPSLHFSAPNPRIDFGAAGFEVVDRPRPWPRGTVPRRAAVSSFGLGGTNVHVVLEEAPLPQATLPVLDQPALLTLSARSEAALQRRIADLAGHLVTHPAIDLAAAAQTLRAGRGAYEHRCAIAARTPADAAARLASPSISRRCRRLIDPARQRRLGFLFPGAGGQFPGMGTGLHAALPAFRETFEQCADLFRERLGVDPRCALRTDAGLAEALAQPVDGFAALFSVEYALAAALREQGVRPDAMLGHSLGEFVAATLAGVFSLEAAITVVAERAVLIASTPPGAMVMVPRPEAETGAWLDDRLAIAAITGPSSCVVSGAVEAIEDLARRLQAAGHDCKPLAAGRAGHSPLMEPILPAFRAAVAAQRLNPPTIPIVSSLTGTWLTAAQATDPDYWAQQLRQTVRLSDGVTTLARDAELLLEAGPGRGLTALLRRHPALRDGHLLLPAMRGPGQEEDEAALLTEAAGQLWTGGLRLPPPTGPRRRIPLPTYPFAGERHWVDRREEVAPATRRASPEDWLFVPSWMRLPRGAVASGPRAVALLGGEDALVATVATTLRRAGHDVVRLATPAALTESRADIVLHLANCDPEPAGLEAEAAFAFHHARAYAALTGLACVLAPMGEAAPDVIVVARGLCRVQEEPILPLRALLLGPARVLPIELPQITCRVLDLPLGASVESVAAALCAELEADPVPLVAWRHGQRWRQDFLSARPAPAAPPMAVAGGTYLIIGGSGGIGFAIARHLAAQAPVKLALLQRHAEEARLAELQTLGAETMVVTADAGDLEQMRAAVAAVEQRFGGIAGVVHAAGVTGGGLMQVALPEGGASNLGAKVRGVQILDALFAGRGLDFLLLTSSIGSLSGAFGQVDNSAANAVLDAYAQAGGPAGCARCLSINWDVWLEVGLIRTLGEQHRRITGKSMQDGLRTAEALTALDLAWSLPEPQIAISTRPLPALLAELEARRAEALATFERSDLTAAGGQRPALDTPYRAPRHDLDRCIATIMEERLGIAGIGIDDDFVELGGDSLLAMPVAAQLRESFDQPFPVATLFRVRSVAGIVDHLIAQAPDPAVLHDRAAIIQRVHRMSPAELRQALAAEEQVA